MKVIESIDSRLKMVDMHQFFLDKIDQAMDTENYFEASWLMYACLENRYFRTISKYKSYCKYSKGKCKKTNNQLALRTKIRCIERIVKYGDSCFVDAFSTALIKKTLAWVKKRNNLMHDLLALETYKTSYNESFKALATEGKQIVLDTYSACTKFREGFFLDEYKFQFPDECMDACQCNRNNSGEQDN